MRIFLDANIIFSATKTNGAVRLLLALLSEREHECWTDAYVMEEARRNLVAKSLSGVGELAKLAYLWKEAPALPPAFTFPQIKLPEKDRPVLAAAIHNRCDALVTGDRKHFGHLYGVTIHGVTIHSPRSLAEVVLS